MISQPTPELMTAVGHAILRSVAAGQGDSLQAAASALERLADLLPNASAECRLTAVLMSLCIEPTSPAPPTDQSVDAVPPPARSGRQGQASKASKAAKASRTSKAAVPTMDAGGRLLPSKEIGGVAVVSQAEARKALGVSCVQMLRLEGQKALQRIQEGGSRLVFYSVAQVQRLLDLLTGGREPEPSHDGEAKA
jgi:hypothetical protein